MSGTDCHFSCHLKFQQFQFQIRYFCENDNILNVIKLKCFW